MYRYMYICVCTHQEREDNGPEEDYATERGDHHNGEEGTNPPVLPLGIHVSDHRWDRPFTGRILLLN